LTLILIFRFTFRSVQIPNPNPTLTLTEQNESEIAKTNLFNVNKNGFKIRFGVEGRHRGSKIFDTRLRRIRLN
jgi:hypothetical protein